MSAALLALALAASPAAADEGVAHILAFRSAEHVLSMPAVEAWEDFLAADSATVTGAEDLAARTDGDQFEFDAGTAAPQGEADALETTGGYVLALPPAPALLARFDSYVRARAAPSGERPARLARRRVELAPARGGGTVVTLPDSELPRSDTWADTVALVYSLPGGQRVVFVYRTRGGLGRVASAASRLRDAYGDSLLVLSRGDVSRRRLSRADLGLAGLTRLGVNAVAPGAEEVASLDVLTSSPSASWPLFLCANLSAAPGTRTLPGVAVFPAGGLRVGVFGLTRPAYARLLPPAVAGRLTVTDPLAAARAAVAALRPQADLVVALTSLTPAENAELRARVPGIDVIIGDTLPADPESMLRTASAEDADRGPEDAALLVSADAPAVAVHLTLRRTALGEGRYGLAVAEEPLRLDESLPDLSGYAPFDFPAFGVRTDTAPAVLPAARDLYPSRPGLPAPQLSALDFWRMAATLVADRLGAEAAFLPVDAVSERTAGPIGAGLAGSWFITPDEIVTVELPGASLAALLAKARRLEDPAAEPPPGGMRLAVGGVEPGDLIHGVPVDPQADYRVALTARVLAQTAQFPEVAQSTATRVDGALMGAVIGELRAGVAAGWPVSRYRELMTGTPLRRTGYWRINFREESFSVSDTKVVSDPRLASVPDARVQGFDQLLIGGASRTDAEYLTHALKWTNTVELTYQRSRLRPPTGDVLSTPQNSADARTTVSLNSARFPWSWMATSAGPSFGVEYEGELERLEPRRKHKLSLLPGVELFDGSVIRSLTLAANLQRDFTPPKPVDQYGARLGAQWAAPWKAAALAGELSANYFFLTPNDTSADLRLELDATARLQLPLSSRLTLAPFVDFYFFKHKITPADGYSAITGLSLGFSRLWKPTYESF